MATTYISQDGAYTYAKDGAGTILSQVARTAQTDQIPIQQAISSGTSVTFVGTATYLISRTITIAKSNFTLDLNGSTLKVGTNSSSQTIGGLYSYTSDPVTNNNYIIAILGTATTPVSYVTIKNGILDGSSKSGSNGIAMSCGTTYRGHSSYITLDDLELHHFNIYTGTVTSTTCTPITDVYVCRSILGGRAIAGYDATNITVKNCYAHHVGVGVNFSSPSYKRIDSVIQDCVFDYCTTQNMINYAGEGVYLHGQSYITVERCTFTNSDYTALWCGEGALGEGYATIRDCTFSNNSAALNLGGGFDYAGSTVTGCIFSDNDYAIQWIAANTVSNCTFTNNTYAVFLGGGAYVNPDAANPLHATSPTIDTNTFTDCTYGYCHVAGSTSNNQLGVIFKNNSLTRVRHPITLTPFGGGSIPYTITNNTNYGFLTTTVAYSNEHPVLNENVTVTATVKNNGTYSDTFTVSFYTSTGDVFYTSSSITLAAGASTTIRAPYTPVTGLPVITEVTVETPIPVAAFTSGPVLSGTVPLTVSFVNQSLYGTSYLWNFGDGSTSTSTSPSHTYNTAGTYTVSLTATNSTGSDTETKTGYIVATGTSPDLPVANFTYSPSSGSIPLTVQFTDTSTNTAAWSWSFGDGGTSTTRNPSHTYTTAGTFSVTLTATNISGSDTETKTVVATTGGVIYVNADGTTTPSGITSTFLFNGSNEAAKIQAVLDYAGSHTSTYPNISLPAGKTIVVASRIRFRSGTVTAGNGCIIKRSGVFDGTVVLEGSTVRGLVVDGDTSALTRDNMNGVYLWSNSILDGNEIRNFSSYMVSAAMSAGTNGCQIINNYIHDCCQYGVNTGPGNVGYSDCAYNITVTGNTIFRCGEVGIKIKGTRNSTISNNSVDIPDAPSMPWFQEWANPFTTGIRLYSADASNYSITITGNTVTGNLGEGSGSCVGISTDSANSNTDCTITNNNISSCDTGLTTTNMSGTITVTGNVISGCTTCMSPTRSGNTCV